MIDAIQQTTVDLDRGQRADDAFRDRPQIVGDAGHIGGIVGFSHDGPMPNDHETVLFVTASISLARLAESMPCSSGVDAGHDFVGHDGCCEF
jgi:hypothetical protein